MMLLPSFGLVSFFATCDVDVLVNVKAVLVKVHLISYVDTIF